MGREHRTRRYPDYFYPASFILTTIFIVFSTLLTQGCNGQNMIHPSGKLTSHPDTERLVTQFETQINNKKFKKASETCYQMIKLVQYREGKKTNYASPDLTLLHTGQTLLDQILADKTRKKALIDQAGKTRRQLKKKTDTIKALKTELKRLTETVNSLTQQKEDLAHQLEQMKQIDLK